MSDSEGAPEEIGFATAQRRATADARAELSGASSRKRKRAPAAPLLRVPVSIAAPPAGLGEDAALAAVVGASLSNQARASVGADTPLVDAAEARRDRRRAARARDARRHRACTAARGTP